MKKLFFIVFIIFTFINIGFAADIKWYDTNAVNVTFDKITYEPLADDERISCEFYIADYKKDSNKENPILVGITQDNIIQLSFDQKGFYFVGVRSILETQTAEGYKIKTITENGVETEVASIIAWSDNPDHVAKDPNTGVPMTFGVRFFPFPKTITNMKRN